MTETELEYQFCFNCDDRKQCYTKPKDCTRIQEEIGLQEMTNEEWLRSLNTEQLAKEIYGFVWCSNELWQQLCCNGDGTDEESNLRIVREWLKQPHTIKE